MEIPYSLCGAVVFWQSSLLCDTGSLIESLKLDLQYFEESRKALEAKDAKATSALPATPFPSGAKPAMQLPSPSTPMQLT